MQRDGLPLPAPRRRTPEYASKQFFETSKFITAVFVPTEPQLEVLDGAYESIGNFLSESPEFGELAIEVHGHGSRQIGTLVRPLHLREAGFDVDAVLLLKRAAHALYGGADGARRLINKLHAVLSRYAGRFGLEIEKWERCVTLVYASGIRVDVAPVIEDPLVAIPSGHTHALIPDRLLQRYAPTNPRGLEHGFNTAAKMQANLANRIAEARTLDAALKAEVTALPPADAVSQRLLSIYVQLMKVHRNITFGAPRHEDLSPASIFITVLAAQAYAARSQLPHANELDLLLDVFDNMLLCFRREQLASGRERWLLPNPWAPGDDLASAMNTPARQAAFLQWHAKFLIEIGEILDSIEQRRGNGVTEDLIEKAFGTRAAKAISAEAGLSGPVRKAGRPVIFATAAGTMTSIAARANTNFGSA